MILLELLLMVNDENLKLFIKLIIIIELNFFLFFLKIYLLVFI